MNLRHRLERLENRTPSTDTVPDAALVAVSSRLLKKSVSTGI